MRSFYYRPGRNAFNALLMGLLAFYWMSKWWTRGGVLTSLAALLFAVGAALAVMNAMRPGPALIFDGRGVSVRKTFGGMHTAPWSDVHWMDIKVFTVRYMGIIPISRNEILRIACEGGVFGSRRLSLAMKAIQLPPGGSNELLAMLHSARVGAVGVAGVAMAGAGKHGWGIAPERPPERGRETFDPDAAIARYLATKDEGTARAPSIDAPANRAAIPQRPSFGRRVS